MLNCNSDDDENEGKNNADVGDPHVSRETPKEAPKETRSLLGNIRKLSKSFINFRSKNKT